MMSNVGINIAHARRMVPLSVVVLVSLALLALTSSFALADSKGGGGDGGDAKDQKEDTAFDLKNMALNDIQGNLAATKKVMKAYTFILMSTDEGYWIDGNHLNPENGRMVYNLEARAVRKLERVCDDPTKKRYLGAEQCDIIANQIMPDLIASDKKLADTVYQEALAYRSENYEDMTKKEQRRIDRRINKSEAAIAEGDSNNMGSMFRDAVRQYKRAWIRALNAVGVDTRLNRPPEDSQVPRVESMAPVEAETVSGTYSFTTDVSDDIGIGYVEFYVNGIVVDTQYEGPFEYSWDTTLESNGAHIVSISVYDTAGKANGFSANVVVSN